MSSHLNNDRLTVFVGNIDEKVTEELLFELFLQTGPLKNVSIPKDFKTGGRRNFAFVTFKHEVSVEYSINLLSGIKLFDKSLVIKKRHDKSDSSMKGNESVRQNNSYSEKNGSFNERTSQHKSSMNSPSRSMTATQKRSDNNVMNNLEQNSYSKNDKKLNNNSFNSSINGYNQICPDDNHIKMNMRHPFYQSPNPQIAKSNILFNDSRFAQQTGGQQLWPNVNNTPRHVSPNWQRFENHLLQPPNARFHGIRQEPKSFSPNSRYHPYQQRFNR